MVKSLSSLRYTGRTNQKYMKMSETLSLPTATTTEHMSSLLPEALV